MLPSDQITNTHWNGCVPMRNIVRAVRLTTWCHHQDDVKFVNDTVSQRAHWGYDNEIHFEILARHKMLRFRFGGESLSRFQNEWVGCCEVLCCRSVRVYVWARAFFSVVVSLVWIGLRIKRWNLHFIFYLIHASAVFFHCVRVCVLLFGRCIRKKTPKKEANSIVTLCSNWNDYVETSTNPNERKKKPTIGREEHEIRTICLASHRCCRDRSRLFFIKTFSNEIIKL